MRSIKLILFVMLVVIVTAACAPDDLDITPSPTTAPTSTPAPTREAGAAEPTAEAAAEVSPNRVLLDAIIAVLPTSIPGGNATWNKSVNDLGEAIVYDDQEGGITAKVFYNEPGGSLSELTFGVFDTADAALAFFNTVKERTRTLENAETRENYPTPNFFGGGTYGSDAIFVQANIYIRVSVPQFSSTMGEPLGPYSRALFRILDPVLAPIIGGGAEATEEATTAP
jgi:hypothetical protein